MSCDKAILEQDDELFDAAEEVVRFAEAAGITLGCAESCTGGLVSGCLTAIEGSSAVVRGGVVSYAIPVKHEILGVPYEGVLSAPGIGAVSSECAEAMAYGARDVLCCDVAVSTTGIAGPGGEEPGKPVGTVWFGAAWHDQSRSHVRCFAGDRADVRRLACREALSFMRDVIVELSS